MTAEPVDGPVLVDIAREAIREHLGLARAVERREPWLQHPAATFVTLRKNGELRGCIGSLDARRPLGADVTHNARAAAFSDPRFPPVTLGEVDALEVEVSLLSAREPFAAASEADALARLRPGLDGVYFEYRGASATFLPQVWESLPDPIVFLGELRRKAGLSARFWHPDVKLSRYTVEKFRDERPRA
jgi:AmmeMemoRadiSam system protein A